MGQAWCKERTCKAQDSKSPLDRVFVRCAHRIYPSLKEEGSVLGGATQRVTSSEIGYAGSPPRDVLTRGRSIDSVDRPFHPSDWVDVNLEVPSPPRTSSVFTNLTVNTSPYPAATPTSSCSNLKNGTPVPPPRRKKTNRGRPLPPKPDEIPEDVTTNLRRGDTSEEPLHLSVKQPKTTSGDDRNGDVETRESAKINAEDAKHEGRRAREVYEHKVNGTGRIISSDVVSGKRTSADKKTSRTSEPGHHHRKVLENEEYERFARSESIKGSSTPNRQDRRKSKELEKRIRDPPRDDDRTEANTRTKNYSTVSLPNYDELDVSRHPAKSTKDERSAGEKMKSKRPIRSSTGSLPAESFLSPFSEKTSVRLEDYIPRRGSVEHLSPYQVLGKLGCSENEVTDGGFMKYDPSKLEDWDLSDISNCDPNRRLSIENLPRIEIHNDETTEKGLSKGVDVVDHSRNAEIGEAETIEAEVPCIPRDMTSSLQKPESFGMTPSPILDFDKEPDDWLADQSRSLKYFDPPTMSEFHQASPICDLATSPARREPFFLNEELHRSALDTIGGSCRNGAVARESDRSDQSRLIFGRSLSNESEPYDDPYESKELRAHSDVTNKLIRTISEESLPREMLEGVDDEEIVDFFDEKLVKDTTNKLKKDCQDQRVKTPPPSPEPKIKAQILDNDHSTLLKVLNDEAAEGSNLSSMTPSLTELEAALSDMLEKEDQPDEITKREGNADGKPALSPVEKLLEPEIVPVEKRNAIDTPVMDQHRSASDDDILVDRTPEHKTDRLSVSLEQILGDTGSTPKTRKVSFCTWDDKPMMEIDLANGGVPEARASTHGAASPDPKDSIVQSTLESSSDFFCSFIEDIGPTTKGNASLIGDAPEKPVRLFQNLEDVAKAFDEHVPTPPRRRNRSSGATKELIETVQSYPEDPDPRPNDRLI
ncbi:uncharacterized protein LOC116840675 [Odontomachus brunneus]|uniref:uncharacterized protein LOC116840675 n=1 Tax=Odontomachus brunneus TaxID=486640 RepID=UPI0013F25F8E|nr:uncharacterized protein LOC116840675 [Odontomachus brunneus]XP_032663603.1 uncharacterized protein LOC116840675 [Odontomachus brunneus]